MPVPASSLAKGRNTRLALAMRSLVTELVDGGDFKDLTMFHYRPFVCRQGCLLQGLPGVAQLRCCLSQWRLSVCDSKPVWGIGTELWACVGNQENDRYVLWRLSSHFSRGFLKLLVQCQCRCISGLWGHSIATAIYLPCPYPLWCQYCSPSSISARQLLASWALLPAGGSQFRMLYLLCFTNEHQTAISLETGCKPWPNRSL